MGLLLSSFGFLLLVLPAVMVVLAAVVLMDGGEREADEEAGIREIMLAADLGSSRVREAALKIRRGALRSARLLAISVCPLAECPIRGALGTGAGSVAVGVALYKDGWKWSRHMCSRLFALLLVVFSSLFGRVTRKIGSRKDEVDGLLGLGWG
jgi:hypothetical protein